MSSKFVANTASKDNGLITPSIERAQEQQAIPSLDLGTSEGIEEGAEDATNLDDLMIEPSDSAQ